MRRFTEELADCWEKEEKEFNTLYAKALKEIKHPHFQYAIITEEKEIKLRIKPFWKWFSGRRVIHCKVKKFVLSLPSLSEYNLK